MLIFLYVQNQRHRGYFMPPEEAATTKAVAAEPGHRSRRSTLYHAAMLGCYGLPLVLLARSR